MDSSSPLPPEFPLTDPVPLAQNASVVATPEHLVPGAPVTAGFQFHGTTQEYFRIWIVNTLLMILTAGLFSAWAKVRKRRYLRGNTELMGHRFDYTAEPKRILGGNLIVLVLFLTYGLLGAVYPALRVLALALAWCSSRSSSFVPSLSTRTIRCGGACGSVSTPA